MEEHEESSYSIAPYKPPLSAFHFIQEASSSPIIQARIPALVGAHKGKPWVKKLKELITVR